MGREVTDRDNVVWTCVQALSGVSDEAAKVSDDKDAYWVVCTPSGGAQSVRIQLPRDWETACSDEDLLDAIASAQKS